MRQVKNAALLRSAPIEKPLASAGEQIFVASRAKDVAISLRRSHPLQFKKVVKHNVHKLTMLLMAWIVGMYLLLNVSDKTLRPIIAIFGSREMIGVVWLFVLLLAGVAFLAYETFYYITYDYLVDSRNLIIKKGVLAQKRIIVPFSRITDVAIKQSLLDVAFGLYDVHISTAAQDSWEFAHICGLNRHDAEAIADLLLEKVNPAMPI